MEKLIEEIKKIAVPGENALEAEHKEYFLAVYNVVVRTLGYDFFQPAPQPTRIEFQRPPVVNTIEIK